MKIKFGLFIVPLIALSCAEHVAQTPELGPGFSKVKDGIYVFAPDQTTTTCSFVVTEAGVLMVDSCNSPLDARRMSALIKKVTDKSVVFLVDTETHSDHTANHSYFRLRRRSSITRVPGPE